MQYGLITACIAPTQCRLIVMSLIRSNECRTIGCNVSTVFLGGKATSFIF